MSISYLEENLRLCQMASSNFSVHENDLKHKYSPKVHHSGIPK